MSEEVKIIDLDEQTKDWTIDDYTYSDEWMEANHPDDDCRTFFHRFTDKKVVFRYKEQIEREKLEKELEEYLRRIFILGEENNE